MKFSLLGIPVALHPSFFIICVLLAGPRSYESDELLRVTLFVLVVFISILWHELGHALAARSIGQKPSIELAMLGGLTRWHPDRQPTPGQRLFVSLAGPGAGFLLGGLVFLIDLLVGPVTGVAGQLVLYGKFVNLLWGALNLLPMLPFDGGHATNAVIDSFTGGRGAKATRYISICVSAICCALALWSRWYWAAFLAGAAGMSTWQALRNETAEGRDEPLWQRLDRAWQARSKGALEPSMKEITEVYHAAQSDSLRRAAAEQLAWGYILIGEPESAEEQLRLIPPGYEPSLALRGVIMLEQGNVDEALKLLEKAYAEEQDAPSLYALIEALVTTRDLDRAKKLLLEETKEEITSRGLFFTVESALFSSERYQDAAEVAGEAFRRYENPDDAYNLACSYSRLGLIDEALVSLELAVDAGYSDIEHIEADEDLALLKGEAGYQKMVKRMSESSS